MNKIIKVILSVVLLFWCFTILKTIPELSKNTVSNIKAFVNIENEINKAFATTTDKLSETQMRYRVIIDDKYLSFLKENFPRNYDQIIRELTNVDFKHPITKAAYIIQAQKPNLSDTILVFSPVNWMSAWPESKFFEYNWVNIAPEANIADASAKENKIYTDENFSEITTQVEKYKPKFILAVFVFTKAFDIPEYKIIYTGDTQYGGAIVYKKI